MPTFLNLLVLFLELSGRCGASLRRSCGNVTFDIKIYRHRTFFLSVNLNNSGPSSVRSKTSCLQITAARDANATLVTVPLDVDVHSGEIPAGSSQLYEVFSLPTQLFGFHVLGGAHKLSENDFSLTFFAAVLDGFFRRSSPSGIRASMICGRIDSKKNTSLTDKWLKVSLYAPRNARQSRPCPGMGGKTQRHQR